MLDLVNLVSVLISLQLNHAHSILRAVVCLPTHATFYIVLNLTRQLNMESTLLNTQCPRVDTIFRKDKYL